MKTLKSCFKRILILVLVLTGELIAQPIQQYQLSVQNRVLVGSTYQFDIFVKRIGPTNFRLGNSQFILTFNTGSFTSPAINRVASSDQIGSGYFFDQVIVGNTLQISLGGNGSYTDAVDVDAAGVGTRISTYQITGANIPDPLVGLTWVNLPNLVRTGISEINSSDNYRDITDATGNSQINTYIITASADANGNISPPGTTIVNYNGSQTYTITPNLGYHVDNLTIDGVLTGPATSYTFNNVITDHSIMATFALNTINVTVATSPPGLSVTIDGTPYTSPQTLQWLAGTNHNITTNNPQSGTAGTRYVWQNWSDAGTLTHSINPLVDSTFVASFSTQYYLTMIAGGDGIVTPSSNWYNAGQPVEITAFPGSGKSFSGWNGSGLGSYSGMNNPTTITMNGPITETASFTLTPIQVTVQTNPTDVAMTVDGVPYTSTQHFVWEYNSTHTIAVTSPQSGPSGTRYIWNTWSDGGTMSHTIIPLRDTTFTANFMTQYALVLVAGTGGNVGANPSAGDGYYNSGASVQITAAPGLGYSFLTWRGSGASSYTGTNNPVMLTMNSPVFDTAMFSVNTYTLTLNATNGTVIKDPNLPSYTHGTVVQLTAMPSHGYLFENWTGSITGTTNPIDVTMDADKNITANFIVNPITYQITTSVQGHGSIIPSGIITLHEGENQQFTFAPDVGYHLDSVRVDGVPVDSTSSYTFINIIANHTISVYFSINKYMLSLNTIGSGSITKNPDQSTYDYGTVVQLIAHPQSGWVFAGWSGDTTGMTNPLNVTMNIDKSITATFTEDPAYQVMYRSFMQESLAVSKDNKNKWGKYVNPKKPDKVHFSFPSVVPAQGVGGQLAIDFNMSVTGVVYDSPLKEHIIGTFSGKKVVVAFAPPLDLATVVQVEGIGSQGKFIKAKQAWGSNKKNDVTQYTINQPRLPMPNRVNALYNTLYNMGYGTTGILVGKVRTDDVKNYGWFQTFKYSDVMKTLYIKKTSTFHSGTPHGFDIYTTGRPVLKQNKYLIPTKYNNKLLSNIIALKLNITASTMKYIPIGFGELIYDDGTDNPLNGMMVKEIAKYGDSLMMGWLVDVTVNNKPAKSHHFVAGAAFASLDSIVAKINSAFEGTLDTLCFGDSLRFKGVKKLGDVSYMKANPGVIPTVIVPLDGNYASQEPDSYTLYQNYPNPFNPMTTIQFDLAEDAFVTLKVYNVLGQEVATLFDREEMNSGMQEIQFNANGFASGVYFYRIVAEQVDDDGVMLGTFQTVKKMMLLK